MVVVQAVEVGAQLKVTAFHPGTPSAVSVAAYAQDVLVNERGYLLFSTRLSLIHLSVFVFAKNAEPGSRLPIDPASALAGTLSASLRTYLWHILPELPCQDVAPLVCIRRRYVIED